jgi:hypothetical protein
MGVGEVDRVGVRGTGVVGTGSGAAFGSCAFDITAAATVMTAIAMMANRATRDVRPGDMM